ncbi:S-adenosyl-L-methionine-dependent methyltransferase [Pleomassaria siparia CBS 279.74]|uniref:rRNA adenine N(6)-methyltransferase n=1 Tax=Pleomassaria siparia CBS 279.74 TaxID=1314801 RepID=A0A6G1JUG8_9PLEO|nr:S-adenosyl-L-methionine-dependent methyltransferase [Pleomassaria siparia CBS 279.74]
MRWSIDLLATSPKYPLSQRLQDGHSRAVADKREKKLIGRTTPIRTQLVSPGLCDDSVALLGPSLEKHKGCDILDLNPGAGLWSQKLHEFLQPRSHVLIEPRSDLYGEYLQPLVDKPGSTFKLLTENPCEGETYRRLMESGLFPHQTRVSPGEVGARQQNNTLLVTGSLMWEPKLPGHGSDNMARQMLRQYTAAHWDCSMFHVFGPVRMILWVMQEDIKSFLPISSRRYRKDTVFIDKVSNISQVVIPEPEPRVSVSTSDGREPRYTLQSLARAMKSARENGQELPAHRRADIHDFAEDLEKMTNGTGIISIAQCNEYLGKQVRQGKSAVGLLKDSIVKSYVNEKLRDEHEDNESNEENPHPTSEESTQINRNINRNAAQRNRNHKLAADKDEIVDLAESIFDLECDILRMEPESPEKATALEVLKTYNDKYEAAVKKYYPNMRGQIFSDIDDRLGLRSPVPRMRWDNRLYEPLVVQMDEVWPKARVSLIDIEPRSPSEGQDAEYWEYFQDFVHALLWRVDSSLPEALQRVQPGAVQLIDQIPILRDPSKGGRLDLNHLRVRMLTLEMLDELYSAYRDWPFKDSDADHPHHFRMLMGGDTSVRSS